MWAIVELGSLTYVLFNPYFQDNKLCCEEYYIISQRKYGLIDPMNSRYFLNMGMVTDKTYPKFSIEMI